MTAPYSDPSYQQFAPGNHASNPLMREATNISTKDIGFHRVLEADDDVGEQTFYRVDIENESLLRKLKRSELATKQALLTRRWQTALVSTLVVLALAGGIGGLVYWIQLQKVITKPFLLYGDSCYMNSRSCDATRMLWCPAGTCICTGNYKWNATAQNCTCGLYQIWTGLKCQDYGYYGDPCNLVPCQPTLTCKTVVNQTYTTGQSICDCDNVTYLNTGTGQCVPRLTYNAACQTVNDCENWLGLSCTDVGGGVTLCQCGSTASWNGSYCQRKAYGWESCASIACDTTRGLTCDTTTNTCECDQYSYWDNVTTFYCQQTKTYSISCQYTFQCNTTVGLSCPAVSTGCNCPATSYASICDCQSAHFWDGQRCVTTHIFNGTCPGQYACAANLVCYLGHCICPGNMLWNTVTANICACAAGTIWNTTVNTCA